MKYLGNDRNIVRDATITATNIAPSSTYYVTEMSRTGGGLVSLSGSYTGQADCTFEVEILNDTIVGAPRVSAPTFSGVGNATLTSASAPSGLAAQAITVTLVDKGTVTRQAYVPFQGVTLRAKSAGAGGNDIEITIDRSSLTDTPTDYSFLRDVAVGETEFIGQEWDFGGGYLLPDGTVPPTSPRLRFGNDPQVYRQYKKFVNGQYVFSFAPALVRPILRGTPVYTVSGSYAVTITDGVDTDTYNTGVTSLYSLLSQIEADVTGLVEVVEPVVNDLTPTGMGTVEVSIITTSFVASLTADGTAFAKLANIDLQCSDDSPTETLTISCTRADVAGSEEWTVIGSSSGAIGVAETGEDFSGGGYSFTIPVQLAPSETPAADLSVKMEYMSRSSGDMPTLCYENLVAGSEAQEKTYTFVYRRRPADCDCDALVIEGSPIPEILGTDGGTSVGTLPSAIATPVTTFIAWKSDFIAANTSLLAHDTDVGDPSMTPEIADGGVPIQRVANAGQDIKHARVSAVLKADRVDIELAKALTSIMLQPLIDVYEENPSGITAAITEWTTHMTALDTELTTFEGVIGADFWRNYGLYFTGDGAFANITEMGQSVINQDVELFLEKYRAKMDEVKVAGGLLPNFDDASGEGNVVWRDRKQSHWFESEQGLLPIQVGYYYHSARRDANGVPYSTREFGIGVNFCEALEEGDRMYITIGPHGNLRQTYQTGDAFEAKIIRGGPVQLGGGQTGTDEQRWRVLGSVEGAFDDYTLDLGTPNTYTDAGGLTFAITPGAIDSELGDRFTFYVEGGQFRWRKDAGSWSANTQIAATVSLSDGLSAVFTPGSAPSFVDGDVYEFAAESTFGPGQLKQPTDGFLETTAATVITVTPTDTEATHLKIGRHTIPEGSTIKWQGSNDNFSTTPMDITVAWARDNIHHALDAAVTYSKYRVTVSAACEIQWLWMGVPLEMTMQNGNVEIGRLGKRYRSPNLIRARGRGYRVEHTALSQDAIDDFLDLIDHAGENDEGRFGVVPNDEESECEIVTLEGDVLPVDDELGYEPRNTDHRLQRVSLELAPIP